MYDIIIRNGRVIDPQNKFDAKADVAIYNGKIVGVGDYQNAESDRVLDAAGHIVIPPFSRGARAAAKASDHRCGTFSVKADSRSAFLSL